MKPAAERGILSPVIPPLRSTALAFLLLAACAPTPPLPTRVPRPERVVGQSNPNAGLVRAGTLAEVDIVKARALGREQLFTWTDWSTAAFAKAKAENRYILIHGAAEWCHWCHVMEETTYRNPEVGKILRDRFVAIRIDVDARPDIEERYEEWGWPATIILDSESQELAKYRGYVNPEDMIEILKKLDVVKGLAAGVDTPMEKTPPVGALGWIGTYFAQRMDLYYDEQGGGWGMRQKAPIGDNATFELRRFSHTKDDSARARAIFSLSKHALLIDPVWGGIYQYSTGKTWQNAHYEKIMAYQADNLSAFAEAFRVTGDTRMLAHARNIERYLNTFLSNDAGAFLVSQDADVGAHDRTARFVDGDVYYALDDAQRRALGIPRIDEHIYAEENGLAVAALATLYQATKDDKVLARMQRAADLILDGHVDARGRVKHDATSRRQVWYLADGSAFGFALARLAEVKGTGTGTRYQAAAERIAEHLLSDLRDDAAGGGTGAFWAHTVDPDAAGVFRVRRQPYLGNVNAARLFAALERLTGEARYLVLARQALAGIARPRTLRDRGRMVGTFLVALDEAGALVWK